MTSCFRFGQIIEKVEKFWKFKWGWVYMRCCGINHKHREDVKIDQKKCVMYAGKYQANKHQCKVAGYNTKREKLCIHIIV